MACVVAVATKTHAQATEPVAPPPAVPPATTTPAPTVAPPPAADVPPAVVAPAEPAPALQPIEPSFPTPAPAAAAAPAEPVAEKAPDPLEGNVKFKAGKGLEIKSNDGNYSLNLGMKGQFLYELQSSADESVNARDYFFIRRMRVSLAGTVFTKDLKYKAEFTFAGQELSRTQAAVSGATPATMGGTVQTSREVVQQVPLLDLFLEYTFTRDLVLHVGQAKVPFGRERILSDAVLQTVDRSIDDAEFNFDRDMGIELRSTDLGGAGMFKYFLGIYTAEERNSGLTTLGTGDFGYLYFARFEITPMGSFEETPVDFARTTPKLSFGLAYAFVQADARSPYASQSLGTTLALPGVAQVDYSFHNFTADLLFKAGGLSVLGAFHVRKLAQKPENMMGDEVEGRDGFGFVAQALYLISQSCPLAFGGNVSMVQALGDESTILQQAQAGANLAYYFFEHGLKIDAEFEHTWRTHTEDTMGPLDSPDNRLRIQASFIL
ncbi:MAG TPA: porin [Polyangiales bacterium]|nr:porin [Polyangiales bacterium]